MSTKTSKTKMEASTEDRRRVQVIRDDNRGGSGSTTGPVDWQQQRSVDFPCYHVANSNTVLYLSRRCIVLIFFSSDSFFFVHCKKDYQYCNNAENILYQVYNNLAYVPTTYRRVKKLRVIMINKNLRKSLACKNGNEILIWVWNHICMLFLGCSISR